MVLMNTVRRSLVVGCAFLLAAAIPLASAQEGAGIRNPNTSTPTTLYMHIDGIQDFPINTQPPDDRYSKSEPFGTITHSTSCLPSVDGASLVSSSFHTYYGYSTPGYVEYDFEENGGPRYHKERGLSFDVKLDTGYQSTIYWYLESQIVSGESPQADPNTLPVIIPQVKVQATIRGGDDVSVGDAAFNEGPEIASGEAGPFNLYPQTADTAVYTVDGKHVYEYAIPLSFSSDTILRDESYNLRIDVFVDLQGLCEPGQFENNYVMPNLVRIHTSPEHRPRMDMAVMNPIRIEYIHPQFVGDELVVHTSFNSPWGNYDVDEQPGGIEVAINGPSPATSMARAAFVQRHHEHFFHQEPVDVSYVWPYKQDGASSGVYTVDVSVWNDQHTAQAVGAAQFQIGKVTGGDQLPACDPGTPIEEQTNCVIVNAADQGEDSPGFGLVAILGLLGAAAVALRRRS
ncbi:MAG: hypothetical protein ACPGQL_04555 [Thermoplasmatota archaeon]